SAMSPIVMVSTSGLNCTGRCKRSEIPTSLLPGGTDQFFQTVQANKEKPSEYAKIVLTFGWADHFRRNAHAGDRTSSTDWYHFQAVFSLTRSFLFPKRSHYSVRIAESCPARVPGPTGLAVARSPDRATRLDRRSP